MQGHKLTEADKWFIKKGRIDSLSRSPFSVGDFVVVCDHKHVMLSNFYDGECPTCHSKVTVPFSHANVEYPRPKPVPEFLKWFFPARVAIKLLPVTNTALGWTLSILIVGVLALILTGKISNERLVEYIRISAFPKTQTMFLGLDDFLISNEVNSKFGEASSVIVARSEIVFAKLAVLLIVLANGLKAILIDSWKKLRIVSHRTKELVELFSERTLTLINLIVRWFYGVINRFA